MPDPTHRTPLPRYALALAIGAVAGALCAWLHTPIPWIVGPLFAVAAARIGGLPAEAPPGARETGQWIIGTAIGLYFTPAVLAEVRDAWWLLAAGAAFALGVGYLSGAALARLANLDLTTGIFASVPGGAPEMARLAELYGGRADRVAAAQSLRILLVVGSVPALFTLSGAHGSDAYTMAATAFDAGGFAALMAATLAGGFAAGRLRVPNAFVLGALAVAIVLTGLEVNLSAMPSLASNAGQLLLGCALGSRFDADFVRGAPRFVAAVLAAVLLSIVLSALFALGLTAVSGRPPATMLLGMAPGGVAEMAITAKVLQLGVPLVTAFHVTRLVVLLVLTGPLFVLARRWWRRTR